jgi:septum formation topological specificity factor MinE
MTEKEIKKAPEPFRFYTRLNLSELTGLKAANLVELLKYLREVPDSAIYHHTHRFLQQHQYLSPEPPNDFAYWVANALGEKELGEELASIDTVQFSAIGDLRQAIVSVIEGYLKSNPDARTKSTHGRDAFYFIKSLSFILYTGYEASDLPGFRSIIENISIDAVYFHIFEARLRIGKKNNDFSYWIENSLGNKRLADSISRLDPYTYTLEDLRKTIIEKVSKYI